MSKLTIGDLDRVLCGMVFPTDEMVCGSSLSVRVISEQVPVIAEALEFASMGLIPAGAYKNREFREPKTKAALQEDKPNSVRVVVNNAASQQNVQRFLELQGF